MKWLIFSLGLCFSTGTMADYQEYPGQVSGEAGQIQEYQPPQPQNVAPLSPKQTPTYQNPSANITINPSAKNRGLEQCRVVSQDGVGQIKAYMADSGPNADGDPTAWLWVPLGMCARINAGNFSGVPDVILQKINH